MSQAHAALILAAGASRRLGHAKQALTRDGEPLLRRAARVALATAPARCVVVLGAQAEALRPALDGLPVEVVRNPDWSSGMGGSLDCLRAVVRDDTAITHSLVLGCDQPALDAAHLHDLLAAATRAASGCAVSAYAGVRGMPAVVAHHRWRELRLSGDEGLRALFEAMAPESLGCIVAPALALDVDTQQDVLAAVERGWLDP
ncbi:nucleotidyltransferase family protein [Xanthomonas sp. AM6]|uniref:nucleotidyltransferase family protein n=1 Tax=Xanthomonas sp. AM6 TaxID=2982531 RepID=UPI0021D9D583|nr:nucleotidyltransferase family protein [Xanthomonas sp. AM6]UYB53698.1 nucleotidyltransferase family protein [Xanthomonas sp. AM6]